MHVKNIWNSKYELNRLLICEAIKFVKKNKIFTKYSKHNNTETNRKCNQARFTVLPNIYTGNLLIDIFCNDCNFTNVVTVNDWKSSNWRIIETSEKNKRLEKNNLTLNF